MGVAEGVVEEEEVSTRALDVVVEVAVAGSGAVDAAEEAEAEVIIVKICLQFFSTLAQGAGVALADADVERIK